MPDILICWHYSKYNPHCNSTSHSRMHNILNHLVCEKCPYYTMLCYYVMLCYVRCFVENIQVMDTQISDLDTLLFLQYINIIYSKYKLKRIPVTNDMWVRARVVGMWDLQLAPCQINYVCKSLLKWSFWIANININRRMCIIELTNSSLFFSNEWYIME